MSKSYFKHNRHTHTARTHTNGYNDLIPLGVYNSSGFDPKSLSAPLMTWFDGTKGLYNQTFLIYSNPNTTINDAIYNTLGLSYDATSTSSPNNYITLNGTAVGSSAGNDTGFYDSGNVTNAWLNGGGTSGGGAPTSNVGMVLCEILAYDGIVTPSDATKVTNYLRTKWGTA